MTKTLTFASLHFCVAFSVGWLLTGNLWVGGALAVIEPACNTVVFYFHEKLWKRIEARRVADHVSPLRPSDSDAAGCVSAFSGCRDR